MPNKHELWELQSMQAAPLSVKISMTKQRIRDWVREYGEDGVYVSFSGGKDSTVLLNLVREDFPNVPAVFCAVPTQYPELEQFAKTFDNVEIVRPKINFFQVCEKYGFPLISKEVSERVYYAQKYLTWWKANKPTLTD
ncbi:MAG: phosphoadenosine phosphosulfate reductase family protein, partial [Oscillospiraceae bacterium]|nr:phosphoadenosine phosphosulfate reductase family protein [Oscillospiraceae bacterium]